MRLSHRLARPALLVALLSVSATGLVGCDTDDVVAQSLPDEGFVDVDGGRIYYQTQGDGEPLVLVHGYPLSGDLFREQRDGLSDDYTVITVDLRGYGRSTGADGDETIQTYASDVLAVLYELGVDRALIGGMSMGGPIVFSMYQQDPERFRGMLLIDTIAAAASPPEAGTWMGTVELIRRDGVDALPMAFMDEFVTGEGRMDRPELTDYLAGIINEASEDAALAGAMALANRPDFQPLLDDIDVPVLVLVGIQDTVYPFEISRRMADAIGSNAEVAVIDDASHAAVIERGDAANDAIRGWADDVDDDAL